MGTSFGYNRQESDKTRMSETELVHMFVDIVARGGNLLLDASPTGAGEISWPQARRLIALGWWLRINGTAIYGTRPWKRASGITVEGPGIRYTMSEDAVHAIVLGTPSEAVIEIDVRLDQGVEATLEGSTRVLPWAATPAGVRITLPELPDEAPTLTLRLSPVSGVHPFDET
jgi:alpha-L-fucosidase